MPRFSRKPNFFVFDLEYSTFISNFTTANCKNLCTLRYYVIKNYVNIAICSKKLPKYEFERSRDIKNRQTVIKALAAFAEDCLSLHNKK